jgi:hypothetical protein
MAIAVLGSIVMGESAQAVDTMGIGAQPCSVFMRERTGPKKDLYMQWILGYISGLAVERDRNLLASMSANDVFNRAIELCRERPDEYLDDVLDDF